MKKLFLLLSVLALCWPGVAGSVILPTSDQGFPTGAIPTAGEVSQTKNGITVTVSSTWVARARALDTFGVRNPVPEAMRPYKPAITMEVTSNDADRHIVWITSFLTNNTSPGAGLRLSFLRPATSHYPYYDNFENDFRVVERFPSGKARTYEGYNYWNEYMTAREVQTSLYTGILIFVITSDGSEFFRFSDWNVVRPSTTAVEALPDLTYPITARTPTTPETPPETVFADGFESGLANWGISGHVTIPSGVTRGQAPAPHEGDSHALLVADGSGTLPFSTRGQIATFANASSFSLHQGAQMAKRGSAIRRQNVSVTAGTRLSARAYFMTNEDGVNGAIRYELRNGRVRTSTRDGKQDYAFFFVRQDNRLARIIPISINRSGTGLPVRDAYAGYYANGNLSFHRGTGYRDFTYTFPQSGTYSFGFGVINVDDNQAPSALLLDDITMVAPGGVEIPIETVIQ